MTRPVLILRPEPGASETAARAAARGLDARLAPLFDVRSLAWPAPDVPPDAILLTSVNGARCAGDALARYTHLPCHAVGDATARAAAEAGFRDIRVGPGDGAALLAELAGGMRARLLHLTGVDHVDLVPPAGIIVDRRIVYEAVAVTALPDAARMALAGGALVLIHSPRAGRCFAALLDAAGLERASVALAAISPAALDAAGCGWAAGRAAETPRDAALLELAAGMCQNVAVERRIEAS